MKHMVLMVGLIFVLIAIPVQAQNGASSSVSTQVTDAQRAEIEKILTEAHMEILASTNQLRTAGLAKYLSDNYQERVGSGNITATTKDTWLKTLESWFSQRASQTITPHNIKVFVLSSELAYVLYVGGGWATYKNGRKGGWGNAITYIWKKEPGAWKIIHQHESLW